MITLNTQELNITTLTDETFEALFYEYSQRLCNYARHFLQDDFIAEDLVQETFVKLWEKYKGTSSSRWSSLLFTILRNGCLDRLRGLSARKGLFISESLADICDEFLYSADFRGSCTPEEKTMYEELIRSLSESVNGLPPRCREVFILSRQDGKTNKEIASILGVSEKAVEKHITKALKIMDRTIK